MEKMAAVNSNSSNHEYSEGDEGANAVTVPSPVDRAKLERAKASVKQRDWKKHCIYRVPLCMKDHSGDDNYYTANYRPRFVSLGPYHYGDPRLEGMQFHKYRILHCMLEHTQTDISTVLDVVKSLEHEVRVCYEDLPEASFPSDKFVEMLLLDGCFILQFLRLFGMEDPVFFKDYMFYGVAMDMLLLENQIPLFVLNRLLEFITRSPHNNQVEDILFQLLSYNWVIGRNFSSDADKTLILSSQKLPKTGNTVLGFLEIFWHSLMYDSTTEEYTRKMEQEQTGERIIDLEQHVIPCVTALKEAGVLLKHKTTTPVWEIEFNAGVLVIPQIMIYNGSESIFLNLMAFEMCHLDEEKCKVTPYILFMDSLVNSASDVAELRAQGIIVCTGESDEQVADLFNRLGKRVFISFTQFGGLSQQINEYSNKRLNRWRANLLHNYFNNPWAIISVIAAAFLMLLAVLQTCYSIAQYYQKP